MPLFGEKVMKLRSQRNLCKFNNKFERKYF